MDNTIFVQIASYRDPEICNTVRSLIKNAKSPRNLHIVINLQFGYEAGKTVDEAVEHVKQSTWGEPKFSKVTDHYGTEYCIHTYVDLHTASKISVIPIWFEQAKGACWARNLIQRCYHGEKYTLQLDSHHRFVENWDGILIKMIEDLRRQSDKPLLTAYLPSFDPDNDPAGRVEQAWKMDFDRFIPEGAVFFRPSQIDGWEELDKPLRARFYSGHFTFADGDFAVNVKHDPEYFFHGEEINLAARAFTHGYDLYHPHRIVAWHEYTRKGRTKVWDDHTTTVKNQGKIDLDWVERNNLSHNRNRIFFSMDGMDRNSIDFGEYDLGTERTLREYEEYAGISFQYRGVQQETLDRKEPTLDKPAYESEDQWKESFVGSHDVRILVNTNDLGELPEDCDFFCVAIHDKDDNTLSRKDLDKNKIRDYIHKRVEWIDYPHIFLGNCTPDYYVVWPHSPTKGWMTRIVRKIN